MIETLYNCTSGLRYIMIETLYKWFEVHYDRDIVQVV